MSDRKSTLAASTKVEYSSPSIVRKSSKEVTPLRAKVNSRMANSSVLLGFTVATVPSVFFLKKISCSKRKGDKDSQDSPLFYPFVVFIGVMNCNFGVIVVPSVWVCLVELKPSF